MANNVDKRHQKEVRQANTIIAIGSIIGLVVCFVAAVYQKAEVPLFLYAIFGGGILGTENVLRFIRAIFRVGGKGDN